MTDPNLIVPTATYRAAAFVAGTVEAIFSEHVNEAAANGESDLASVPMSGQIEMMLDRAFWASLRREEGTSPKVSLAFLSPNQTDVAMKFESRLKLSSQALTKLGPGVERPGIHLGVWYDGEELYIWGTTHKIPAYCFVLDVSEPGLLVIKHRRSTTVGKFSNVVVLTGDQIKVVDESSARVPGCPVMLTSLLGSSVASPDQSVNILIQIATSMRAHKHGGSLLVVPSGSDNWRQSILQPMKYSIYPAFTGLRDLLQSQPDRSAGSLQADLTREIDGIAGLTAIDGATVITDKHEVLAFGAKIVRTEGSPRVEKVLVTEPVLGGTGMVVNPANSGGTRHMSAAQFVHDQRDSIALVASQDGLFTIFTWSPADGIVQAHRIDSLLI